jgi:hypothetical protein
MTIEARRIPRGVGAVLLALALVFVAAAPSAMADTIYPVNKISGASFDNGSADGFSSTRGDCTLLANLIPVVVPGVACDVTNEPNATDGAGLPGALPGSLESRYHTVADGLAAIPPLALITGDGRIRSGSFTVGASGAATLLWDRRALIDAVIAIGGQGTYTFSLVNETAGTTTALGSETLTRNVLIKTVDTGWQTLQAPITTPVVAGSTYHLQIDTHFQDQIVAAAESSFTFRFDNIRFRVADGTPTFVSAPTVFTDPATAIG